MRLTNVKIFDVNKYNYCDHFSKANQDLINELSALNEEVKSHLMNFNFISAAHQINMILLQLNNLVHSSEFWKHLDNEQLIREVSVITLEFCRIVTILYKPFIKEISDVIYEFIGHDLKEISFKYCHFRQYETINKETGYFKIDYPKRSKIFLKKLN